MITETKTDIMSQINNGINTDPTPKNITLDKAEWDEFYSFIVTEHGGRSPHNITCVKKKLDALTYPYRGSTVSLQGV